MTRPSAPDLLALHGVRILGFADSAAVARRFTLDPDETHEALLDAEARGWVTHTSFAGQGGWSLTASGRAEGERRLRAELADAGGVDEVQDVHRAFLPLNARVQRACTDWQLRPRAGDRLAENDHTDARWDTAVLDELEDVASALTSLARRLGTVLARLDGYDARFTAALENARAGDTAWVDRTDVDSCHRVWFELHEDLIASLGLERGVGA